MLDAMSAAQLALFAAAAPGPDLASWNTGKQLVGRLLAEAWQTRAHEVVWLISKGALLGAGAGLGLAILLVVADRRSDSPSPSGRSVRLARWTTWTVMLMGGSGFAAFAGGWLGLLFGAEVILRHSQIGTQALPAVGDWMADGLAALHLELAPRVPTNSSPDRRLTLEGFRTNGWELDVPEFQRRIGHIPEAIATNLTARLQGRIAMQSPVLASGLNNRLAIGLANRLAVALAESKAESELSRIGVLSLYRAVRTGLPRAAAQAGKPDTISRSELSAHLVREGVVPTLMAPVRSFAWTNIALFSALAIAVTALPPILLRRLRQRFRSSPTGQPSFQPLR